MTAMAILTSTRCGALPSAPHGTWRGDRRAGCARHYHETPAARDVRGRRRVVSDHAGVRRAHSPTRGQASLPTGRCRTVARGPVSARAAHGRPLARDRPAAIDTPAATPPGRARVPPATGRRSPCESRYKKFNKYFMREIL
ncbi:hypothetical protein F7R23_21720 [Burkholderia diffusa]|nr:hypothetical protein F7R23_21720 [Burkholderia diffusa]